MSALNAARPIAEKEGVHSTIPVAAATTIFQGALAVMAAGFGAPGSEATDLVAVGIATETVENAGADGAKSLTVKRGTFLFHNHDTDAVTAASIGSDCFIVDDQTVAATDDTGGRSRAGTVIDLESGGVWVRIGR